MNSWWIIIVALFLAGWAHAAEGLQPYLLLDETQGNSKVNLTELKEGLEEEGFVVLGSYKPAEDSRRKVLSFTHPKLLKVVSGLRETAGYFSVWRMALTEAETGTEISLQNPEYWGNTFLQDALSSCRINDQGTHFEAVGCLWFWFFKNSFWFLPGIQRGRFA